MRFKSSSDRSPSFSFGRLVCKTVPFAIRALGVLCLGSFFAATPQVQPATPTTVRQAGKLELNHSLERDLGPGQIDMFTVDATAGQFLRVVANQMSGLGVLVRIVGPDGKAQVTAFRAGGFGAMSVAAIVPDSVPINISVEMAPIAALIDGPGPSHYAMELTDLRDPTEKDRLRIDAEARLRAAGGEVGAPMNPANTIDRLSEAASLWRDIPDGYERGGYLQTIGNLYRTHGDDQKALSYFQQALPIQRLRATGRAKEQSSWAWSVRTIAWARDKRHWTILSRRWRSNVPWEIG